MLDYIIVGQGLAGSFLAYHLLKKNKKICIIDEYKINGSSNIASGIANPVTGRKLVKTWLADEVFPFSWQQYKELEKQFGKTYTASLPLVKVFASDEDRSLWQKKQNLKDYKNVLADVQILDNEHVCQSFNCAEIKQGYWVDVPQLMRDFRTYFLQNLILMEEQFDFHELHHSTDFITYKKTHARKIVFCEGYQVIHNPFFKYLPFTTAKGEILYFHSEELKLQQILTKSIHLVPLTNSNYLLGSTFIWNDLSDVVTQEGKTELLDKLQKLVKCKYSLTGETSGIRPTIKDRRPVLGSHPVFKNVFIFNGLGTKGVTLSTYFALQLIELMEHKNPVLPEVNISRFINYYN